MLLKRPVCHTLTSKHHPAVHTSLTFHLVVCTLHPPLPLVLAGAEFDALSPEQQTAASKSLAVFARVEPLHKLKLVELLRDQVRVACARRA